MRELNSKCAFVSSRVLFELLRNPTPNGYDIVEDRCHSLNAGTGFCMHGTLYAGILCWIVFAGAPSNIRIFQRL